MARIQLYALICAAFVLGIIGVYSSGIARGQDKIKRKLDKKLIENMRTAKEVDDEISELNDTSLSDRANRWVRKDNR